MMTTHREFIFTVLMVVIIFLIAIFVSRQIDKEITTFYNNSKFGQTEAECAPDTVYLYNNQLFNHQ